MSNGCWTLPLFKSFVFIKAKEGKNAGCGSQTFMQMLSPKLGTELREKVMYRQSYECFNL